VCANEEKTFSAPYLNVPHGSIILTTNALTLTHGKVSNKLPATMEKHASGEWMQVGR